MATKAKKPAPDNPLNAAERTCLKCDRMFYSSWEGERICKRCKDSHAWRTGDTPYEI